MHSSHVGHDHPADHHIVEMGNYEIGIGDMNVHGQRGQEQSGEATDGEEANEAEGIQHGRCVTDGAAKQGGGPVEYLDGGGNGNQKAQQREIQAGVHGHAGHEHMMTPNQDSDHGNANAGSRDERITEYGFAREAGDQLAHHAHAGQNHDVHGGMRIEPENVLEQDGIAADGRIENADVEGAFQGHQSERNGDNRCTENLNQGSCIVGPDEQRQTAPGHTGRAHLVNGNDEIKSGENGGESGDEHATG